MNRAVVLAIRQVEAKQELGETAEHGHHHTELEDLPIGEVLLQGDVVLVLEHAVEVRKDHLFARAEDRTVSFGKSLILDVIGEGVDLGLRDSMLPRRGRVHAVSKKTAVGLGQLEA